MMVTIDLLRIVIESMVCYLVYNYKNMTFKHKCDKKLVMFSLFHLILITTYRYFFDEHIICRLISVFFVFIYFWIEIEQSGDMYTKNNSKNLSYLLTFSIFMNLMLEGVHFFGYAINRFLWQTLNKYSSIKEVNVLVSCLTFLILYLFLIFLIYKFRFIEMKDIKSLSASAYRCVPILFGLCLSTVIYIKHQYYQVDEDTHGDALLWLLMLLLPMYLGFYKIFVKFAKIVNSNKNFIANKQILDWILSPAIKTEFIVSAGDDSLAFLDKYEYITSGFIRKLSVLGVDITTKGFSWLVFSMFLTSVMRGTKNWNFKEDVFNMTDKLLKSPVKGTTRYYVENIIKKIWILEEYETLKDEYYKFCFIKNHHSGVSTPSAEEFLINMSSNNKISLQEVISKGHSLKPFLRQGAFISINGEGVLITGSNNVAKNNIIFDLVSEGHFFIANGMVELRRVKNSIYGNACKENQNFMHPHNINDFNTEKMFDLATSTKEVERVDLVINLIALEESKNKERFYDSTGPLLQWVEVSGVRIPYIDILSKTEKNTVSIIKIATMNNRQRFLGFVASNELFENLGVKNIKTEFKIIKEENVWENKSQ